MNKTGNWDKKEGPWQPTGEREETTRSFLLLLWSSACAATGEFKDTHSCFLLDNTNPSCNVKNWLPTSCNIIEMAGKHKPNWLECLIIVYAEQIVYEKKLQCFFFIGKRNNATETESQWQRRDIPPLTWGIGSFCSYQVPHKQIQNFKI